MLGMGRADFVHPDDLPKTLARWQRSLATGDEVNVEYHMRRRESAYRWFYARGAAGEITKWLGTLTDVHKARGATKLLRENEARFRTLADDSPLFHWVADPDANVTYANRAKDSFIEALSHELRTSLAPVLMTVTALAEDERLSANVRADLATLRRNIALETQLIDDLLELTRITCGKLPLREERCDVHSLLRLTMEIVCDEAQARPVAIKFDLAARQTGLNGDPARLQ